MFINPYDKGRKIVERRHLSENDESRAMKLAHRTDDGQIVRSLFGDLASFAMGSLSALAGALLTAFHSGAFPVWVAAWSVAAITVLRFAVMLRFLDRPSLDQAAIAYWKMIYLVSGSLHVFVLGCWAFTIFVFTTDLFSQMMAFAICVGYLVGVQGRNFASSLIVRVQLTAAALPVIAGLLVVGSPWYGALAALYTLFLLSILRTSARMHAMFTEVLNSAVVNEKLARTDSLTGLGNRAAIDEAIVMATQRRDRPFALHFVDLDRFKHINDSLGHAAGDELLKIVAQRFVEAGGPDVEIARFAGDEFVVLQSLTTHGSAVETAKRLQTSLKIPIVVGGLEIVANCCIGTSLFPRDGTSAEILMQRADTALFRAKRDGRAGHRLFSAEMAELETQRMQIETDLRAALQNGTLTLAFQPIIDPQSRRVISCEALARWHLPGVGEISPARFLPIAEEAGLMNALTDFTLTLACKTAASWPSNLSVAVNLSPNQLYRTDLVRTVRRICETTGFKPDRLELEITENNAMVNLEVLVGRLTDLKKMNIRLSLDDFGTGFSNLGRIASLPIDTIKIDRAFVTGIEADAGKRALLRGAIQFISSLNMGIIVEGVETLGQLEILQDEPAITAIQGFIYGTPLSAPEILDFIQASERPSGEVFQLALARRN